MIEKRIMNLIYQPGDIVLFNYYMGAFECDVLRIKKSGYTYEYEIKKSVSDFKADFKKRYKFNNGYDADDNLSKHELIQAGKRTNYFYFVYPEGLISFNDVPKEYGIITFSSTQLKIVRRSRRLHNNLFNDWQETSIRLGYKINDLRSKLRYIQAEFKQYRERHKKINP